MESFGIKEGCQEASKLCCFMCNNSWKLYISKFAGGGLPKRGHYHELKESG